MTQQTRPQILLVDLPADVTGRLAAGPGEVPVEWRPCARATVAELLNDDGVAVIVLGVDGDEATALSTLREWRADGADAEIVVIRPPGTGPASPWKQAGAGATLTWPVDAELLGAEVERAVERGRLRRENRELRRRLDDPSRFPDVIGSSRRMRELLDLVAAVADSEANILIVGENGTGKEVIANAIHRRSRRASGPFIKINCAAIPKELIESELFGHRRGAFTGAVGDRQGLLGLADGGSLLLDEIGEMPSYLQAKLLRVLQEREYRPVGSERTERVDFRLICSTNVDVDAALADGRLREDLYFRINTITVRVPPLRERPEDLVPLCQHFIDLFNARHGRLLRGVSPEASQRLLRHHWPGNVRELENVVERGVLVARGDHIEVIDLPDALSAAAPAGDVLSGGIPMHLTLAEIERLAILQTLQRTNWNKQEAAQRLGLYRPTLYSKMKRYGIETPPRSARHPASDQETTPAGASKG